jgi:alpha-L-fucosidase 2
MQKTCAVLSFFMFLVGLSAAQTKVACIGNSITAGSGADTSYPLRLQKLLGSSYSVQNEGVSSTTMLKKGDVPYWTKGKLSQALAFKPDIVTIKLGTNDTKPQNWDAYNSQFKTDYGAMIDTLNTLAKKPKIWLVLPVPVWTNSYSIRDSALKKIIIIVIKIASERSLHVIDCNTPLLNFSKYFVDGVHPNDAGADTIAHVIFRALSATAVLPEQNSPQGHYVLLPSVNDVNGALFVTIPFSGKTRAEVFDLRGRFVGDIMFAGAGRQVLKRTSPFLGAPIVRIRNQGQSFVTKVEILK